MSVQKYAKTLFLLCAATILLLVCVNQMLNMEDLIATTVSDPSVDIVLVEDEVSYDSETTSKVPTNLFLDKHALFQPNLAVEFPYVKDGKPRIPHIIHQVFNTRKIPDNFVDPMRSFVKLNPTWKYRFWTYESGKELLEKKYPFLIDLYNNMEPNDVRKSDVVRYSVIHEYGGVYSDIDVTNLRSLNITTTKYSCIIPPEPFEHAVTFYGRGLLLSTAVLLCRPKHPFLQRLLQDLQFSDLKSHPQIVGGPLFLTSMYMQYNNLSERNISSSVFNDSRSNSPYFYKGEIDEESDNGVYIPNTQYFGDSVDPMWINKDGNLRACVETDLANATVLKQRGCKEFESRRKLRREKTYTFTVHHWFHLWIQDKSKVDLMQRYDVLEIIPKAILWDSFTGN